jgi:sugar phosphate isomerase/epimerase
MTKDGRPRISTHLGFFGSGSDRFMPSGYREPIDAEARVEAVSMIEGLDGVELHFPAMVREDNVGSVKALLADKGLLCSIVSVSLWSDRQWAIGSLTHRDPDVRRKAIEIVKSGMGLALELGAGRINLWLGQDGFDYPLEVDYRATMGWLVEGLRQCADAEPKVQVCLEYKPKEPRAHSIIDSAARTLWLCDKVGRPNVGALLDVGHAWMAYENAAQSAVLLHQEKRLFHLHFNDTDGAWDWDWIPGTVRFWEVLELLLWLREIGYDGWYSLDIFTPRSDPVASCALGVSNLRRMWALADRLDREALLANLGKGTQPDNLRLLADAVFKTLDV